jgi:hypothetical protein
LDFRRKEAPVFVDKRKLQKQLDQEVMQFLANGGKIQKIPTGRSAGHSQITRHSRQVNPAEDPKRGDNYG